MKAIITAGCSNYLAAISALARSAKEHVGPHVFITCFIENELHPAVDDIEHIDRSVLARDLPIASFDSLAFGLDLLEASTAIKPAFIQWTFDQYPDVDKVVFLDPDMLVSRDLTEVWEELDRSDILLTPHLLDDEDTFTGTQTNMLRVLRHGTFNLGFIAIRRSDEAARLVDWWARKLRWFCHDDPPSGLFVDQKWMDLAPSLFEVSLLKNRSYNVANWNVARRQLSFEDGGFSTKDGRLALYHFSGFFSGKDLSFLSRQLPCPDHPVFELRRRYAKLIADAGHETFSRVPWTYSTFVSGEVIDRASRIAHRRTPQGSGGEGQNPFSKSNTYFLPLFSSDIDHD